jgi:hypothetical protein
VVEVVSLAQIGLATRGMGYRSPFEQSMTKDDRSQLEAAQDKDKPMKYFNSSRH